MDTPTVEAWTPENPISICKGPGGHTFWNPDREEYCQMCGGPRPGTVGPMTEQQKTCKHIFSSVGHGVMECKTCHLPFDYQGSQREAAKEAAAARKEADAATMAIKEEKLNLKQQITELRTKIMQLEAEAARLRADHFAKVSDLNGESARIERELAFEQSNHREAIRVKKEEISDLRMQMTALEMRRSAQ